MERGKSSLNPNAAPFIPFHKRAANDKNEISELTEGSSKSSNETARPFSLSEGYHGTQKHFQADVSDSDIHEVTRTGYENLSDQMGEQYRDDDSQRAIAYLANMFPDISEQFLVDVHSVNGGDIEASVDMLKQLVCFPSALPKCQEDSLDTSEDSESKVKAEGSSVKPKSTDSSNPGASFQ